MRARFTFHPDDDASQVVTVGELTADEADEIRVALASDPDAVIRVSCSVSPGAESWQVRLFRAGLIRDFETY